MLSSYFAVFTTRRSIAASSSCPDGYPRASRSEHADGTGYGGLVSPRAAEVRTKAFQALRGLGFRETEVKRALEHVMTHTGNLPGLKKSFAKAWRFSRPDHRRGGPPALPAREGSDRLSKLLGRSDDLSRIEAGQLVLDHLAVDPGDAKREAAFSKTAAVGQGTVAAAIQLGERCVIGAFDFQLGHRHFAGFAPRGWSTRRWLRSESGNGASRCPGSTWRAARSFRAGTRRCAKPGKPPG